jgi:hypothetical protein
MSGTGNPVDDLEPARPAKPRSWRLEVDCLGRPLTANAMHKKHPVQVTALRGEWRDAATVLARAARIPALGRVAVTAQARYRTRRSPSDTDACSPSVKGVIDGLVAAGVVRDDKPPFVASVTYLAPVVGSGLADALIVWVEES